MDRTKKAVSSSASIYNQLKDEILSLDLKPGSMIDENSIAKRFAVSRSPVREAFIRLTADGLLTSLPNKTSQISPLEIEEFPDFMDALDLIQRAVTRFAAMYRTEDDLRLITQHNLAYKKAVKAKNVKAMINLNYEFHMAISNAAKNKHFTHIYRRLLNEGRRTLRIYYQAFEDNPPEQGVSSHDDIIAAIRDKKPDKAEKLAHAHSQQLSAGILRYLGQRKTHSIAIS